MCVFNFWMHTSCCHNWSPPSDCCGDIYQLTTIEHPYLIVVETQIKVLQSSTLSDWAPLSDCSGDTDQSITILHPCLIVVVHSTFQTYSCLEGMCHIAKIDTLCVHSGIVNGRVFPKPVSVRMMQSNPRTKASAQSNCHGCGLWPVCASQIAERVCHWGSGAVFWCIDLSGWKVCIWFYHDMV